MVIRIELSDSIAAAEQFQYNRGEWRNDGVMSSSDALESVGVLTM